MPPITTEERVRLGAATPAELAELGAERVHEIKSDPEHMQVRGCVAQRAVKAPEGYDPSRRILRLVASTHDKDHYGDRISVRGKGGGKGWLLRDYARQGGVYLWSHNLGDIKAPIGQALKTWRGKIKQDGVVKEALLQDVEFFSEDDGPHDHFKFAGMVYLMMSGEGTKSGKPIMGSSVGLIPRQAFVPKSKEERESLDLGVYGIEFREQVLLENSATPTPANPFASVLAGKGGSEAKSFEARILDECKHLEEHGKDLIDPALVRHFAKHAVLGPDHAAEVLAAKIRSRVFVFDGEGAMPEEAPEGFDSVADGSDAISAKQLIAEHADDIAAEGASSEVAPDASEPEEHEPEEKHLDIVKGATTDDDGVITLTLDVHAQDALGRAYEAADTLTTILGGIVEAIDKSTEPDLVARGAGNTTLEDLADRVEQLARVVERALPAKATATRDEEPENRSRFDVSAVLRAAGANNQPKG